MKLSAVLRRIVDRDFQRCRDTSTAAFVLIEASFCFADLSVRQPRRDGQVFNTIATASRASFNAAEAMNQKQERRRFD